MALTVVVLTGAVAAGKTSLAQRLNERYGAQVVKSRDLLVRMLRESDNPARTKLQEFGQELDRNTAGHWLADAVSIASSTYGGEGLIVVDAARTLDQLASLREAFGRRVVHVHLATPSAELERRYEGRNRERAEPEYAAVRADPLEASVDQLSRDADVVIDTARSTPDDVFVRAACHLGLTAKETGRLVDVIIGGQYGSEGKGHIAYHIAPEYDVLLRVGGPNAGHQVIWPDGTQYTHRSLPSGTLAGEAHLIIGPGAVLAVDVLLDEIAACHVDVDRLAIDPQAMIITNADRKAEASLVKMIGSTGQGGGAAAARRIGRARDVALARDIKELKPYTGRPVVELLEEAYARGERMLLEGTQGTGLSLYHGSYPHVTSRDTTVGGCLAEAGIAATRVRKVVMVCRTYPIRVMSPEGHSSGPMAGEVAWDEIAERSGIPIEKLKEAEKGSVSRKQRRVAEFDWVQLRGAAVLNEPTDIALTFTDYLSIENRQARRFEQLTEETIHFIEEVGRVAGAPVTLIGTEFHARSIIDRRSW